MSILSIINILVSILFVGIFSILSFTHILQFQLNEYLFLRYKGYLKDVGLKQALVPFKVQFPAKSIRNLIILATIILTLSLYYGWLLLSVHNEVVLMLFFVSGYVIAKIGVILGVLLTTPLAFIMRKRLIFIAQRQLKDSDVKIIAVTGSYGKSSVKEFLHRLLSTKYLTGKTRGNHNTEVGIAIELGLQVRKDMTYFVAEMGAYTQGDIANLCGLYKPEIGIITGIGNQHVSLFGSQKNIIKTKFEMVEGVKGNCYVNIDWNGAEEVVRQYRKKINENDNQGKRIITYGTKEIADVTFKNLGFVDGFSKFGIHLKNENLGMSFNTNLIGKHNLLNLVPAILVARELNIEDSVIAMAIEDIEPILGKLSLHESNYGFNILNDSYNSNVNGFIAALTTLKELFDGKKLYVSSLGVFELGDEKTQSYVKVVKKLRELDVMLLTTDKLFKEMDDSLTKGSNKGEDTKRVIFFDTQLGILNYIKNSLNKKNALLIEGRHSGFFTNTLGIKKAY